MVRLGICLVLLAACASRAPRGAAVITLVMPPLGEGVHGNGGGYAVATGAESMYFNPALLASLPDRNRGRVDAATHQGRLIPILGLPDLYRTFLAGSVAWPDCRPGLDVAAGYYRNYVSFGIESLGAADSAAFTKSDETVQSFGLSLRWNRFLSVGANLKFIRSELYSGRLDPSPAITGDLGFLVSRTFPARPGLTLRPSAGLTLLSHDFKVRYRPRAEDSLVPMSADPASREVLTGLGFSGDLWQVVGWESALDWEWDPISHSTVRRGGLSLDLASILGLYVGRLYDTEGQRWESYASFTLGIDLKKGWIAYHRLFLGDFSSSPDSLLARYPLRLFGGWAPNFRAQFTHSFIRSFASDADPAFRAGQQEFSLAFTL